MRQPTESEPETTPTTQPDTPAEALLFNVNAANSPAPNFSNMLEPRTAEQMRQAFEMSWQWLPETQRRTSRTKRKTKRRKR